MTVSVRAKFSVPDTKQGLSKYLPFLANYILSAPQTSRLVCEAQLGEGPELDEMNTAVNPQWAEGDGDYTEGPVPSSPLPSNNFCFQGSS